MLDVLLEVSARHDEPGRRSVRTQNQRRPRSRLRATARVGGDLVERQGRTLREVVDGRHDLDIGLAFAKADHRPTQSVALLDLGEEAAQQPALVAEGLSRRQPPTLEAGLLELFDERVGHQIHQLPRAGCRVARAAGQPRPNPASGSGAARQQAVLVLDGLRAKLEVRDVHDGWSGWPRAGQARRRT
ncbi:MAG: hypothetical protein M5U12_20455 [Verrucomicrobia bacterium]|nr:hypothetical protein [Verrucomicrobiota bacterium]